MIKQEVESCSSAVNHRIPEGLWLFFSQPGSCCHVRVSLTLLCVNRPLRSSWRAGWDTKRTVESKLEPLGLSCPSPVCKPQIRHRGRAWALFSSDSRRFLWLSQLTPMDRLQRVNLLVFPASSCVWSCTRSYMTKFVFVARPLTSACLHTLSSAWMCTRECVFEGQRSQSCPMTTEDLKNPWPLYWSCRATLYRAKTSHRSQM